MRIMVAIMACIGFGAGTLAIADPAPGTPPAAASAQAAAPAAPASSPAPAASSQAATQNSTQAAAPHATAASQSETDDPADEKRLRAAGYKPEMHNGEKIWCRKEDSLGSRLATQRNCGTASSLAKSIQENQRNVADSQRKTGTYMKGN